MVPNYGRTVVVCMLFQAFIVSCFGLVSLAWASTTGTTADLFEFVVVRASSVQPCTSLPAHHAAATLYKAQHINLRHPKCNTAQQSAIIQNNTKHIIVQRTTQCTTQRNTTLHKNCRARNAKPRQATTQL